MDTREKLIKARLGLLALAEQLQNVRQACKAAGISRSHYYEIQQAYEKYGPEGLAPQPRRRPRMPNQTPPELERQILEMTTQFPTYSYVRIAGQLRLTGVGVSAAAVAHTKDLMDNGEQAGGWHVYGKTGAGMPFSRATAAATDASACTNCAAGTSN